MPAKSPEALAKKKARRAERMGWKPVQITTQDLPVHKISKRRMMPKLPRGTTKAELRDMLTEAVKNTARGEK
jgi:hypothetical protein